MLLELVERLRGPTLRVQRLHQRDAGTLPEPVLGDERLEQRDRVLVPCRRLQGGAVPLDRDLPQLLEPNCLQPGEIAVGEAVVRASVPQLQRREEGVCRLRGRLVPGVLDQRDEHLGVHVSGAQLQHVAALLRLQHLPAARLGQLRTQFEHGAVQRCGRVLGRVVLPQQVDQPVDADHLPRPGRQRGQKGRLPRPAYGERCAMDHQRHCAEHPHQHVGPPGLSVPRVTVAAPDRGE